jgi:3-hydroxyanthranilate 3,4-dioxygenase
MQKLTTINFTRWIQENKHLLKPPVGNKCIFDGDLIVMVIGGPNARTDYHVNQGEEFFYQVEGDIVLKIIENGKPSAVEIRQGDIFLLPSGVPHSPQRPAGSIGLVIERKRAQGELDGFVWHCDSCGEKLYEETFELKDIATQFPPIFERFYSDPDHTKCKKCGTVLEKPGRPAIVR